MLRKTIISSIVGIVVFFNSYSHHTPTQVKIKEESNFVIIGAFSFHDNATRFVKYVTSINMSAEYALNAERKLYYVYSLVSNDTQEAVKLAYKLRENENFEDAWVFRGTLTEVDGQKMLTKISSTNDFSEYKPENIEPVRKEVKSEESNSIGTKDDALTETETPIDTQADIQITDEPAVSPPVNSAVEVIAPVITEDYKLYVNAVNTKKFKEVKGAIEIRDHQRNKKIKIVKSHELFGINDPKNGKQTIRLVSQIFGYRPIEHVVDLDQPVNDSTSTYIHTIGDSIIVNFDLERMHRGEIAVMWNVLFFKDAAIMRPSSKDQLNNLLVMLKENDKLKVKIHGHTNGKSHGKILHLNLDDKDFFSISGNHIEDNGSAKKLSEYRAYTIQHYLIEQGIDESRLDIKGWGGQKMMFDKHDSQARQNVRVEVEILEL